MPKLERCCPNVAVLSAGDVWGWIVAAKAVTALVLYVLILTCMGGPFGFRHAGLANPQLAQAVGAAPPPPRVAPRRTVG